MTEVGGEVHVERVAMDVAGNAVVGWGVGEMDGLVRRAGLPWREEPPRGGADDVAGGQYEGEFPTLVPSCVWRLEGDAGVRQGPENPLGEGRRGTQRRKPAGVVVGLLSVRVGLGTSPRALEVVKGKRGKGGQRRVAMRHLGMCVGQGRAVVARRMVARGQRGVQW